MRKLLLHTVFAVTGWRNRCGPSAWTYRLNDFDRSAFAGSAKRRSCS